ncbi:MAG: DegT/DnrJ/EryC1/StrS family aminotransferase [Acidiferrobacterales bacterium]
MSENVIPIPFLDLTAQFKELESEWLEAVRATGARGSFILGPQVSAFEREFAEYVGVKHAIAVANGTDSLVLSLRALGIGRGDEVITTPFTFFASAEAIDVVGATPVFADILPGDFTLDPRSVRERISPRTRAILPVHIFGHAADMDSIMEIAGEHGLAVIEDCAQSFGARVGGRVTGSIGAAGSFSFYPTKVLGGYGDGGMVTTNSAEVDERIRRLRNHGAVKSFIHVEVGCNSRLDEIQAAVLRIKLRSIDSAIAGRRRVADSYNRSFAGTAVTGPAARSADAHVYNLYTVRTARRDQVRQRLTDRQIGSSLCYPQGLHLQDVYRHLGYRPGSLPVCEQATTEVLSLPVYPGMPDAHIMRVCQTVLDALS